MARAQSNRRSFFVQMMSGAAGAWAGVSAGGLVSWLSGCGPSSPPASSPPGPEPGPPPQQVVVEPAPTSTMAVDPSETYDPPPGPAVKYGGVPIDEPMPAPAYGGPSMQPDAGASYPGPVVKYGGPPIMQPKYGGSPGPRPMYGGPTNYP